MLWHQRKYFIWLRSSIRVVPIITTIHERELQGCGRGVHTRAGACTQVWARVHICACDCGGEKSPSGVTPQSPPTLLFATVFLIDLVLANSSVSPLSLYILRTGIKNRSHHSKLLHRILGIYLRPSYCVTSTLLPSSLSTSELQIFTCFCFLLSLYFTLCLVCDNSQ